VGREVPAGGPDAGAASTGRCEARRSRVRLAIQRRSNANVPFVYISVTAPPENFRRAYASPWPQEP